jgi:bifunctional DNA-binding transcriptional regulator/antitoxin component of YhaV-PrlF toxin-antitoxin module
MQHMKTEGVVGQLVIPSELRRVCRIGRGTRGRFKRINDGIAIYPKYEHNIDRYCGILAGLGLPPSSFLVLLFRDAAPVTRGAKSRWSNPAIQKKHWS